MADIVLDVTGGARTVDVPEEIDMASAPALRRAASEAVDAGCSMLVLDFRSVTFMDSQGVKALLDIREELAAAGCSLVVDQPGRAVRTVLEITGLEAYLGLRRRARGACRPAVAVAGALRSRRRSRSWCGPVVPSSSWRCGGRSTSGPRAHCCET